MRRALISITMIFVLCIPILIGFSTTIQSVKAEQTATTFYDDFGSDSHAWTYLGSAYRDAGNQCMVLTPGEYGKGGVAFFKTPIQGSFTASFRYKVGEGYCHGDGFTMFFYKEQYSNLDSGGSLAFSSKVNNTFTSIPGYGVEFDAWQNIPGDFAQWIGEQQTPQGDPSEQHIALIQGFAGNHLKWVEDSRVDDNQWHQVTISVRGSSLSVYLDKVEVLNWTGDFDRTFSGFGFSAGTGGPGSNWHIIEDFSIEAHEIHTAILTLSCVSATAQQTFNVYTVSGDLTFNDTGISGAPIYISDSVNGGESWRDLALVYTDSDGRFSAMWLPTITGNYMLKTVFRGDENYLGAINIISFAIQPNSDKNVFSITSNSTITALNFDAVSKQLSFNVSGTNGTSGYTYVFIPKALLNDTSTLDVRLDGNPIDYTTQSQNDGWLLYFSYHHSMHTATISLDSSVSSVAMTSGIQFNVGDFILIVVSVAIVLVVAVLVVALRAWKKNLDSSEKPITD